MTKNNKPKILIVEDDPFSVQLLKHNLKNYAAELLPATSTAEDALKVALEFEPDVALIDIYLSGQNEGLEVAKALQEHFDIPIIYITGYSADDIFQNAKQTDPFGYILKPFTPKELTVTLDMALYKHGLTKQLKASRALLSTTLDALHEAVITVDSEWRVAYANPVAKKWLKVHEAEAINERLVLRAAESDAKVEFDPTLFADSRAPICRIAADGEAFVKILVVQLPGERSGYAIVVWDVSEEYLQQKDARGVLAAMESMDEGLLLLDPLSEKIEFASKGFEKTTGWLSAEVLGESPTFLLGPRGSVSFWQGAREALKEKGFVKRTENFFAKDGKERVGEWHISRVSPHNDNSHGQIMVFLRDVTSSRQIEEELRQSQKIEAVGRLAGGVAHDFNNLLSVINSYADLMTLKLPEGDPLRKYVGSIRTAGQRAADLVGKLLTFSRRDSVKPTLVDVRSVTEEMQKMLRRVIREDIDISMNFDENMMALWADPLQLEQLIMNLCVNARDAIESENKNGGRINLSWKEATLNEAEATKKKLTAGNYLTFSVSDTGCGIEPKIVAKIFEPYFTTKASGKGTGLGLSIVYAIVQQLKGAIEVESTLGKGTTFRVYFPASDRPARTKSQMPIVEAPQHGDEHIMVVEDEENFSECLHSLLTLHGYKVHCAKDAVQAEEIFKQSIYPIKLLITDVVLPNTSGQAMARKMKDERPELKVIFMSGYDHSLKILQEFPYTALVLQKPFSVVSILNKIREVLDKPQEEKKIQVI